MFHVEQNFKRDRLVCKAKDYVKNNKEFLIYKDSDSGILWTDVQSSHDHKSNYDAIKYTPHQKSNNLFTRIYNFSQNIMFYYKRFVLGREIITSKEALDFGSGDGAFFKHMAATSLKMEALDPFFKAKHIEDESFYSELTEVPDNQYDMVFMWHSLEHVPMLENTINDIYKKIKDNGSLIVAVPNHRSFDSIYYNEYWAALDVPRHLWHFTTSSIKKVMLKNGFKLKKSFPLPLDAYYISYLSAKQKKSYFPIIEGIAIGTISNFIGIFSGQFSSNIYVFSKKANLLLQQEAL